MRGKNILRLMYIGLFGSVLSMLPAQTLCAEDALPSWQDGQVKQAVLEFVERVSAEGGADFVPEAERIAVFDNDGTLWVEQPMYTQLAFALDRLKTMAGDHPEWQRNPVFKAALDGDLATVAQHGKKGLLDIIAVTHAGITTDEFADIAAGWLGTARHPKFDRLYTEMTYQPMLELLDLLRSKGFTTYIVSGGGIEFMRPVTEALYGIPPEQVVGSSIKTKFEMRDGKPVLVRLPEVFFIDDKAGKPVGINHHIGRRPILAAGNSDGDLEMLQWATMAGSPALGLLVHHDDAEREYAYDRESHMGRLDKAMDQAAERGWLLVSMKEDWKRIFTAQ